MTTETIERFRTINKILISIVIEKDKQRHRLAASFIKESSYLYQASLSNLNIDNIQQYCLVDILLRFISFLPFGVSRVLKTQHAAELLFVGLIIHHR